MAANPDLAQKLLPSAVQDLFNGAHVARALLAHYATVAPKSAQASAYHVLDDVLRKFNTWIELAGADPDQVQTPKPSTPQTPEQSPPLTKATV